MSKLRDQCSHFKKKKNEDEEEPVMGEGHDLPSMRLIP